MKKLSTYLFLVLFSFSALSFADDINELEIFKSQPKGELTIVISEKKIVKKISQILSESDKRIIKAMIDKISIKEISDLINNYNKVSKKEIYNYCLKLKHEK